MLVQGVVALTMGLALAFPSPAHARHRAPKRAPHVLVKPPPAVSVPSPPPIAAPVPEKPLPVSKPAPAAPASTGPALWYRDPRLGIALLGALALLFLVRALTQRARRPELRVEVVLDAGHEGRFMAALLPAEGESVAEALAALLAQGPSDVLDPTLSNVTGELRALLARAVPVRHLTSLGKLAPGPHRVVVFGRSAPQRELQLRVGGATGARSSEAIRNHAQERRVQLLAQPLTVPFDFRAGRTRQSSLGHPRPVAFGGAALPLPADSGPGGAIQDTRTAELYRRAREAFTTGHYELAAELYHQAGDKEQEARCYLFGGKPERVALIDAEQAESRGEKALAVNHYLRAKDHESAARILRELGREPEALHLQAQEKLDAGDRDAARALFEQAGDLGRAGELLELDGRIDEAIALYERGNAWEQAARLAAREGRADHAAADFERAGLVAEAAVLRLKLAQPEAAQKLAESVPPGAPGELLALTVLARLYQTAARDADLRLLAQRATRAPLPGEPEREAVRALAAFFKQLGQSDAAHALYVRLAESDPTDLQAADEASALAGQASQSLKVGSASETLAALDMRATTGAVSREALRAAVSRAEMETGSGALPPTAQSGVHRRSEPLPRGNDRYRLDAELGRGAMGVVYRGTDQLLGRPVAIKMLPGEFSRAEQLRRLFLDEARALAALNHPYVVQVYDLGELDGSLFLAMELVEGESLEKVLERTQLLPMERVARVLDQLGQALEAAHGRGIVHRDVKPANVMVTADGSLKLMDFGIAAGGGAAMPKQVGTPRYMSPEQIRGEEVDARADLYAFGVLAFQLCTGTLPFPDENVLEHHLKTPAPSARALRGDLPESLDALIARLLAKQREERPASASEVRAAVAAVLARAA